MCQALLGTGSSKSPERSPCFCLCRCGYSEQRWLARTGHLYWSLLDLEIIEICNHKIEYSANARWLFHYLIAEWLHSGVFLWSPWFWGSKPKDGAERFSPCQNPRGTQTCPQVCFLQSNSNCIFLNAHFSVISPKLFKNAWQRHYL